MTSNVTSTSNRPGQYTAVRQTGSRRLYGNAAATTAAAQASTATATATTPSRQHAPNQSSHLRETMRSKPPTSASTQRRQQNVSSSASIRSFQSDLERINEDYNKTYAYTGQTSASAMRAAAPASARGRRADSVVSSAMSDTSEAPAPDSAQRKKASRVSFSDVDENEGRSRGPSPNPERRRSAMKQPSPATAKVNGLGTANGNGNVGRGVPAVGLMNPPALIRRASNSSIHSTTSASGLKNVPALAAPLQKTTQQVPAQSIKAEDGDLSTIGESNSAYSDADEDFKASPALKRQIALPADPVAIPSAPLQLTQRNLAVATSEPQASGSPVKSAMRKTPAQNDSSKRHTLETDSQLDVADDESDDSFAARRRAKKLFGRKSITTLRGNDAPQTNARAARSNSVHGTTQAAQTRPRSNSITSQQSRTSQGPSRMVSLRQSQPQTSSQRRQSLQNRTNSTEAAPPMTRRISSQSLQPPLPPKSTRRASVAGSVAESVRSDAVSNHIAVMEIAQRRVQKLLHPDAGESTVDPSLATFADAPERKRSSFERKRPSNLSRQNSNSSMVDRSLRDHAQASEPATATAVKGHRRAASDDKAFATTLRGPRPIGQRSSSMIITDPAAADAQSINGTPKKTGLRRISFHQFRRQKATNEQVPPMPAMRRYSTDSDVGVPTARRGTGTTLSAGTLRTNGATAGSRNASDATYKKSGKPKKFQALRRLLKMN